MSNETRVMAEGELRYVAASGSGVAWATASGAATGLLAYVTNFTWTSAQTVTAISDRGIPTHNKFLDKSPIQLQCTVNYVNTAQMPPPASGAGASVPMYHLEFRMKKPEISVSAGSGEYMQFMGVPVSQLQFTEGGPNTMQRTMQALAMATAASGYLG